MIVDTYLVRFFVSVVEDIEKRRERLGMEAIYLIQPSEKVGNIVTRWKTNQIGVDKCCMNIVTL